MYSVVLRELFLHDFFQLLFEAMYNLPSTTSGARSVNEFHSLIASQVENHFLVLIFESPPARFSSVLEDKVEKTYLFTFTLSLMTL